MSLEAVAGGKVEEISGDLGGGQGAAGDQGAASAGAAVAHHTVFVARSKTFLRAGVVSAGIDVGDSSPLIPPEITTPGRKDLVVSGVVAGDRDGSGTVDVLVGVVGAGGGDVISGSAIVGKVMFLLQI